MGHRERHPEFVEGCDVCRWRSVSVAPSATPTRNPTALEVKAREKRWDGDMAAYKRLRHQGLQPPRIDGCAALERDATEPVEIDRGTVLPASIRKDAAEVLKVASEIGGVSQP